MPTDKEFVQAHWDGARFESVWENSRAWLNVPQFDLPKNRGRVLCPRPGGGEWILSGNVNSPFEFSKAMGEDAAWEAASKFTKEWLVARELQEIDIEILKSMRSSRAPNDGIWQSLDRILAREQAALAVLKVGMR